MCRAADPALFLYDELMRSISAWPCIGTLPGSRLPGLGGLVGISVSEPPGNFPAPEAWLLCVTDQSAICALAEQPPTQVLRKCSFLSLQVGPGGCF